MMLVSRLRFGRETYKPLDDMIGWAIVHVIRSRSESYMRSLPVLIGYTDSVVFPTEIRSCGVEFTWLVNMIDGLM